MKTLFGTLALAVGSVAVVLSTGACTTESFCFSDCGGNTNNKGGGGSGAVGDGGGVFNTSGAGGGFVFDTGGNQNMGGCQASEIPCNGTDDNCNGQTDEGTDFTASTQCGNCATNCDANTPANMIVDVDQSGGCTPPPVDQLGKAAGTCHYKCAQDYLDLDPNQPGCETYCFKTSDKDDSSGLCGADDNCNGKIDEDIDFCTDPQNCGACSDPDRHICVAANAVGKCVQIAGATTCTPKTTDCQIDHCDPGWFDADGLFGNGCEYKCTPTTPSTEVCDGLDNDCDGKFDNEDSDLTGIGGDCFGGAQGECITDAHKGKYKCITSGTAATLTCCDVGSDDVKSGAANTPPTGVRNGVCVAPDPPHVLHPGDLPEKCNGLDDNCQGGIDENPVDAGQACGNPRGRCALGIMQCDSTLHKPVCEGQIDPTVNSATGEPVDACNGTDDDCDGVPNGTVVASNTSPPSCLQDTDCKSLGSGTMCLPSASGLVCKKPQTCTSDADCSSLPSIDRDGVTVQPVCMQGASTKVCAYPSPGAGAPCDKQPDPPCVNAAGAVVVCGTSGAKAVPQPCKTGTFVCVGTMLCSGSTKPVAGAKDKCGEDTNCDGALDNQPNLLTDVHNCGTCGNDCNAKGAHANWTCNQGTCEVNAAKPCLTGYINCDGTPDCERQCTPSGAEVCNNFDDNCDCNIDEGNIPKPKPDQVCGVATGTTDPNCTTNVTIACVAGAWKCTFPAGICTTGTCSTSPDPCDGIDNNCNSVADESFKQPFKATKYLGQPCASDDGMPAPGDGACRGTGTYVCNAAKTDTQCSATKDNTKAGDELCDGIDNDCDGSVDEPSTAKGTNATYFVKPDVVSIGASRWMFKYEASRPNGGTTNAGSGNGYFTSAPAGTTLDKTVSCSVQGRIPWFNVTPQEAQQTCANRGGQLCTIADWKTACHTSAGTPCQWGYSTNCTAQPPGTPARLTAGDGTVYYDTTKTPFCNLGPFDFDATVGAPNADGLLVTGSALLKGCSAGGIFDITGNLREITVNGAAFTLMGGAYSTSSESGATCDFDFYSVDQNFKFFDTGFRCCFTTNPSP